MHQSHLEWSEGEYTPQRKPLLSYMVYVYNYFYVVLLSYIKAILNDLKESTLHKESH